MRRKLQNLDGAAPAVRLASLRQLARHNHDFPSTIQLDRAIGRTVADGRAQDVAGLTPVRLALLSTSTTHHLPPAIRVAGLGRGVLFEIYEPSYNQARQELADTGSGLHAFAPDVVLCAHDPYSLFGAAGGPAPDDGAQAARAVATCIGTLREQWRRARTLWNATVIQQVPFNPAQRLMGENESRVPGSWASLIRAFQEGVRAAAAEEGIDVIDLDGWAGKLGLAAWHSPALWHRSKQEVHPACAALYGDLVARVVAARYGRAAKCLVLDLDNTLWGGVIGDDGLGGIVLGQGSPVGEGFLAFQHYAARLAKRGVVLAVCSKNDEARAREPFQKHPEMALRLDDIACFVANWDDKASNLRRVAAMLSIGLDALVFADDNPFERELVRRELPDVFVPELPDDPADYADTIAASGCFEGVALTREDLAKTAQYQSNARRQALLEETTDLAGYLAALDMSMQVSGFDEVGLPRIVQLINKTNQFNLTTRRYSEPEVRGLLDDRRAITLQLRLLDRFGDNGIIAVIIGRLDGAARSVRIETWLMSCRVLGRQVEQASLNVLAEAARALGAETLVGDYLPSGRNGMVEDHYAKLGFSPLPPAGAGSRWSLALGSFVPHATPVRIVSNRDQ